MDSGRLTSVDSVSLRAYMPANAEQYMTVSGRASIAKWICAYISVCPIAFLFSRPFVIENLQILLPSFVAIALLLYFSSRLGFQIDGNIFGEIGFVYLVFAVAYTVFPAFGFLTLNSLSSGVFQNLAQLNPDPAQLGLQLWRHDLFIAAVATGYLLFRGRHTPKLRSFPTSGDAEKLVIGFLFVIIVASAIALWGLSAPVDTYIDNYTKYDNLSWFGTRMVVICTDIKNGGTFVLLAFMFRSYKRYRLYIWVFVLLRAVEEVLGSSGARIDAFMILVAASMLYHYFVKQITLKKGLLVTLALGLVFSTIEIARFTDLDPSALRESVLQEGMPAGELGAVFIPGFHLYAERAGGTLPPVPWQIYFNDFISLMPLAQTKWIPMYWYAENYFPNAVVPPMTMGPIAMSALWGGESFLFVEGLVNGIFFAYLMRWFARNGGNWRVATVYVFCYSSCIMCLKYSIFWHLEPLVKMMLPLILIVSLLAKGIQKTPSNARARSLSRGRPSCPSSARALLPPEKA
jgi:hypothetical protein